MVVAEPLADLIEAKLARPPIRPGAIGKADVIASLRGSPSPCATIVAPAGYGKTMLVSQWADEDPRPFAWVTFDAR